ncbi:MAG: pseudoazurin, partial [Hyphomicrobiales bacterium]
LVVAGEPVNAEEAKAVKHPGKAKNHFAALFGDLTQ